MKIVMIMTIKLCNIYITKKYIHANNDIFEKRILMSTKKH